MPVANSLTYPEVGATRGDPLPPSYGHVHRDVPLGAGQAVFDRAVTGLLTWQMHKLAGLTVKAAPVTVGAVAVFRAGWGPLHLTIPCRVVYTIDEPHRRGFAYGTLPGHPERGEEAFTITMTDTGGVRIQIRAFSRPASLLARAGGPLTRRAQQYATDRYIKAMRQIAEPF